MNDSSPTSVNPIKSSGCYISEKCTSRSTMQNDSKGSPVDSFESKSESSSESTDITKSQNSSWTSNPLLRSSSSSSPIAAKSPESSMMDLGKGVEQKHTTKQVWINKATCKVIMDTADVIVGAMGEEADPDSGSSSSSEEGACEFTSELNSVLLESLRLRKKNRRGSQQSQRSAFDESPSDLALLSLSAIAPMAPQRRVSESSHREEDGPAMAAAAVSALCLDEASQSSPSNNTKRNSIRRSSSARTANEEEQKKLSPAGRMSHRRSIDMLPQAPRRRRSSQDELERELVGFGTMRPGRASFASSGASTPLSAEALESYVMARIPDQMRQKLPQDAWKKIFSVAATSQISSCSSDQDSSSRTSIVDITPGETAQTKPYWDEITIISDITSPTGVLWCDDSGSHVSGLTIPTTVAIDENQPKKRSKADSASKLAPPSIPSRSRQSDTLKIAARALSTEILLQTKPPAKRFVSFSTVQIRHYERVLEVNPCTSSGPSVGIGWRYVEDSPKKVDAMEGSTKRGVKNLIMSRHVRQELVRDLGYTKREIAQAVRRALKAKNQRLQTVNNLHVQTIEYMVEKSRKKIGRLLRGPKKEAAGRGFSGA